MSGNEERNDVSTSSNDESETDEYDQEPMECDTNDVTIEAILDENERVEQQERDEAEGSKGVSPSIEVMNELQRLQEELNQLKRPHVHGKKTNNETKTSKRLKIDVTGSAQAYKQDPQVRSTKKQLRSASTKQLRSATSQQLQVSAKSKQPSSATVVSPKVPTNVPKDVAQSTVDPAEVVTLSVDDNDPLRKELERSDEEMDLETSDDENDGGDMFENLVGAVDIQGSDEVPGVPLAQIWADKINLAWKTKIGKTAHNFLMQKYRTPSNLDALKVPQMNSEIWKLCNKWQRKADLNMSAAQRTLIKVVSAVVQLQNSTTIGASRATRQIALQTTADVVALLGKVNRELAAKRKLSARPVLVGDYKSLATTTKESTENLFGDTLTQDIKDVNIRRKIGEGYRGQKRDWRGGRRYGNRSAYNNAYYYNNNYSNNNDSFLWRGRGRGRSNYRASPNQNHRGHSHQGKH